MSTLLQWGAAALILLAIPLLVRMGRRHGRGRAGAAVLMLGLAFGHLFDPARAQATESIEKRREQGQETGQSDC